MGQNRVHLDTERLQERPRIRRRLGLLEQLRVNLLGMHAEKQLGQKRSGVLPEPLVEPLLRQKKQGEDQGARNREASAGDPPLRPGGPQGEDERQDGKPQGKPVLRLERVEQARVDDHKKPRPKHSPEFARHVTRLHTSQGQPKLQGRKSGENRLGPKGVDQQALAHREEIPGHHQQAEPGVQAIPEEALRNKAPELPPRHPEKSPAQERNEPLRENHPGKTLPETQDQGEMALLKIAVCEHRHRGAQVTPHVPVRHGRQRHFQKMQPRRFRKKKREQDDRQPLAKRNSPASLPLHSLVFLLPHRARVLSGFNIPVKRQIPPQIPARPGFGIDWP